MLAFFSSESPRLPDWIGVGNKISSRGVEL
jgi:hypothetical protein